MKKCLLVLITMCTMYNVNGQTWSFSLIETFEEGYVSADSLLLDSMNIIEGQHVVNLNYYNGNSDLENLNEPSTFNLVGKDSLEIEVYTQLINIPESSYDNSYFSLEVNLPDSTIDQLYSIDLLNNDSSYYQLIINSNE